MNKLSLSSTVLIATSIIALQGCGQSTSGTAATTTASASASTDASSTSNSSGNSSGNNTSTGNMTSTCSVGYINITNYGCLPQSSCPTGSGLYNGNCVSQTTTAASNSNCVSISQPISFSGTSLQTDSSYNINGGVIPQYSTFGTITVGSSTTSSGTLYKGNSNSNGSFQMNVQSTTSGSVASATVAVSGSLSLGSAFQQSLQNTVNNGGYGSTTTPCVSGIAIQGHLNASGTDAFTGFIYLYLNNTQHGISVQF